MALGECVPLPSCSPPQPTAPLGTPTLLPLTPNSLTTVLPLHIGPFLDPIPLPSPGTAIPLLPRDFSPPPTPQSSGTGWKEDTGTCKMGQGRSG